MPGVYPHGKSCTHFWGMRGVPVGLLGLLELLSTSGPSPLLLPLQQQDWSLCRPEHPS